MTNKDIIDFLIKNHNTQKHRHEDLSGIGKIRPATKREIIRAYRKIGKEPPPGFVVPMRLVRKKVI